MLECRPTPRLAALVLAVIPATACAQAGGGYGDYLAWENWARVVPADHGGLASSWDRAGGHFDANQYEFPPGLIYGNLDTVAKTITGPGIVYRFWMSHFAAVKPFVVRMYFDGETTPRISTDSEQILGGTYSYFADPLVNTFAGGQVCYEPIPFRESLRIETENRAYMWHWYQYSYRTFPAGTEVTSYTGALDAAADSARLAVVAMFRNVGRHPAGESATAVRHVAGPTSLPPGGDLTVADLVGPGVIRRLNLRMSAATDAGLDSLNLLVFYDGEVAPAIDAPVGWFFGAGHDRAPYKSLPLGTDSPDGFYCYWPMPFHRAARVALKNVSHAAVPLDSCVVEHEPQPVANDAGYLHTAAKFQIRPIAQTWDVMASVSGTGHYVGNLLYVQQGYDNLQFLEGDDLVVVDGADSLHGTGTEDAYNGGSYYSWNGGDLIEPEGNFPPYAFRPLCGILRVDKTSTPPFGRADQYRWRIGDRVPFARSLEVDTETSYADWHSQWISVVFWYQLPEIVSDTAPSGGAGPGFGLELRQAPNPVTETTAIRYALPADGPVVLELLDVRGRRVETLLDGPGSAGAHEIGWRRGRLPGGVYFFRLRAGDLSATRKLVLVR